jgi:hypothetical protein
MKKVGKNGVITVKVISKIKLLIFYWFSIGWKNINWWTWSNWRHEIWSWLYFTVFY